MSKPKLTVIEGGIPYLIKTKQKLLVSAYVTNTRLMGVLALYAHWRISGTDEMLDFHQFFYIDCEESGLETYTGILGSDHSEIDATEQALVGGLGARKNRDQLSAAFRHIDILPHVQRSPRSAFAKGIQGVQLPAGAGHYSQSG